MAKWILTVKDHPYVKDDNYTFGSLSKLEVYIGQNDIRCDHIAELAMTSRMEETKVSYVVAEIVPVSGVRLILEVNKSRPQDKHHDDKANKRKGNECVR